ncbi:MAG: PIN domain-containing protein [Steroidobacteraceae bacterium]|nr:PIN domain-containing protein [Steroidobacteraceae bacterium]
MKLLDVNVLMYAHDTSSVHHARCRDWLVRTLKGDEHVGLPWQTLLGFVRIVTNPRAVRRPLAGPEACAIVDRWLARPQAVVVEPGERYWSILRDLVARAQVQGPLVSDAALAALALEQGATLCTTDRDFRRFDGLRLLDPTEDAVQES